MESTPENPSQPELNGPDSPSDQINESDSPVAHEVVCNHDHLFAELESLRQSYQSLQFESSKMEKNLLLLQREKDDTVNHNGNLTKIVDDLSRERDSLRDEIGRLEVSFRDKEGEFEKKIEEELKEKEEIKSEIQVSKQRIEVLESEKKEKNEFLLQKLDSVKEFLVKIIECLDDEKVIDRENNESVDLWEEMTALTMLASKAESKVSEYKESKKKEKRELENSVVSLTEENRDTNTLLRIALVEKESVEKTLNRLKGNTDQKRVPLLQIAERSLQRVGFGFMMGGGANEQSQSLESSGASVTSESIKSDTSDCDEEVVSLASTVERIMKNLRLEITQLRRSLEESRSDTERLQSLSEKQAKTIEENIMYIKELEDRERVLAQNVEELLLEIKETEEDVARWREACELEVEAGKHEMEERDNVVAIMKQELERTKAALEISNGKLKLKEELAAAAMAAQAAAETSLQLADSRAAGFRERIEELTKQIEESESKERNSRRKVRHICWPWRAIRLNPVNNTNSRVQNVRRMLPEMQALLHYSV